MAELPPPPVPPLGMPPHGVGKGSGASVSRSDSDMTSSVKRSDETPFNHNSIMLLLSLGQFFFFYLILTKSPFFVETVDLLNPNFDKNLGNV